MIGGCFNESTFIFLFLFVTDLVEFFAVVLDADFFFLFVNVSSLDEFDPSESDDEPDDDDPDDADDEPSSDNINFDDDCKMDVLGL